MKKLVFYYGRDYLRMLDRNILVLWGPRSEEERKRNGIGTIAYRYGFSLSWNWLPCNYNFGTSRNWWGNKRWGWYGWTISFKLYR